jgi:dihydropteroate synthase
MNRKTFYWKLRNSELALGERTLIMGILNVTPDSFSDGSLFQDPDRAYARALELEEQGADIIDIGAESTRPGSARISADEEWQRLVPVLKRLRDQLQTPLSIDTYKSEIAARALDYGIEIINDPSGLTLDANLAKTAASANAGLVLTHMRGTPETWAKLAPLPDAPGSIARDLEATVNRARRAGVEHNRIVIDPGLGFGKRGEQNAEILAHLNELARLELPILVGPSRKSFLHQKSSEETLFATAAAVTAAILQGACIVRVHDVKEMRAVALVADEIARAAAVPRVSLERPSPHPKMARAGSRSGAAPMVPDFPRPPRQPAIGPPAIAPEARPEAPAAQSAPPPDAHPPQRNAPRFDHGGSAPRFDDRGSTPRFDRGRSAPPRDRDFRGKDGDRRPGPGGRPPRDQGDRRFPPRDQGDRRFPPREGSSGNRPAGDRPLGGRPQGDRPQGDRPPGNRPPGDRFRDRNPGGDRPRDRNDTRSNRSGPPRSGDRNGAPRGPNQRGSDQRGPDQRGPDQRGSDQRGKTETGPRPPKRVFRKRP